MPAAEGVQHPAFRLLLVPGVTVDKWVRTWSERLPGVELQLVHADVRQSATALLSAEADAGLVRLPVDQDVFHAIPLYTEVTVVAVPRDHVLTAADTLDVASLADETLLRPLDDVFAWTDASASPAAETTDQPATTAAAVELVATGAGVLILPESLARKYHRRDLAYRAVTDAPTSSVALVWLRDRHTDLVEEMIGIVRGRTANSTRGRAQPSEPSKEAPTDGRSTQPTLASGQKRARRDGTTPRTSPRRRGR